MEKVVFLDRDGVISKDSPDHIKSWEEFHFLPKSRFQYYCYNQSVCYSEKNGNKRRIGRNA